MKTVASIGGGTNSTAMIVGLWERGEALSLDFSLFADTGGEKPHTYAHLKAFDAWCAVTHVLPPITAIHAQQPQQRADRTLENECLRQRNLPAKAYGRNACSVKWKIEPQQRFIREWAKRTGYVGDFTWLVGYDAGEYWRAEGKDKNKEGHAIRYPLIEWGWDREDCIAAIKRVALPLPGKSACFFCPSSKKWEILELSERYPDLMTRALIMERNAELTDIKGLGRHFAWSDVLKAKEDQCVIDFSDAGTPEVCSTCYDGSTD